MVSVTYAYLVASVLAAVCCVVSSLKCHQCTSYEHAKCNDPFVFDAPRDGAERKPKTDEFLKDCPTDKNYTICRKIYQNVRGDVRIIRKCGWEEYKNDCYKTVLEEYNTYVCQCKHDGCNGASTLGGFGSSGLFSLTLAIVTATVARLIVAK